MPCCRARFLGASSISARTSLGTPLDLCRPRSTPRGPQQSRLTSLGPLRWSQSSEVEWDAPRMLESPSAEFRRPPQRFACSVSRDGQSGDCTLGRRMCGCFIRLGILFFELRLQLGKSSHVLLAAFEDCLTLGLDCSPFLSDLSRGAPWLLHVEDDFSRPSVCVDAAWAFVGNHG